MTSKPAKNPAKSPAKNLFKYVLAIADDHMVLSQNLITLCGKGPTLEEDIAVSNIALDLLGQARELYTYAAQIEGKKNTEDALVFFRTQEQFYNIQLVEQPNIDFAHVMLRQLFVSAFLNPFWVALGTCKDGFLSGFSRKAEKETAYHLQHAAEWVIRLAGGTQESRERMEVAVARLAPYTAELFACDDETHALIKSYNLPDPQKIAALWHEHISTVFERADLTLPTATALHCDGRHGRHTENLGHLLSDLQYMQKTYPGLQW